MRTFREPRHRSHPVPGFRRARIRTLVGGASAAGAAVVIALGAVGGTYASFDARTSLDNGATITAGTASLALDTSGVDFSGMYPGLAKAAVVTVTNTGDVPLQLRVDALEVPSPTVLTSALQLRVTPVATAAGCTGSATGGWTGTVQPGGAGDITGATLGTGASRMLCVVATLPLTAPQAAAQAGASGFGIVLGGRQQ